MEKERMFPNGFGQAKACVDLSSWRKVIGSLSEPPIAVYPAYIKLTGGKSSAILLAQIIYWDLRMDGEFYKTNESWMEDLFMGEKELLNAKKAISAYITIEKKGVPAQNYYSVKWDLLISALMGNSVGVTSTPQKVATSGEERSPLVPPKRSPLSTCTETTKETTTRESPQKEAPPRFLIKLAEKKVKYNETASSDSYETVIDADTGSPEIEIKAESGRASMKELIIWGVKRRGGQFLSYPKQVKALTTIKKMGYGPEDVRERWVELETNEFYHNKGFDFADVASSLSLKPPRK